MPQQERASGNKRVVVTGIGPITAMGMGSVGLWQSLKNGDSPSMIRQDASVADGKARCYQVYSPSASMLNKLAVPDIYVNRLREWYEERIDPDHVLLIQAMKMALDDSGLTYDEENNTLSLFLLHENPGLEKFFSDCLGWVFDEFINTNGQTPSDKKRLARSDKAVFLVEAYRNVVRDTYNLQPFMFLYALTKAFCFHGYSLYVNNACASGVFAMESAYQQVSSGQSNVAIVAGGDWPSRYLYKNLWFDWEGLYSAREKIQPFSDERDGFLLGDAACAVVLEEYESAVARKARIYGEYLGGGFDLEGWKVTVPSGSPESYVRALRRALEQAQVHPNDIGLINPHGVATGVGDAYESKGLREVFGSELNKKAIVGLKPYIGHTLGVCGLIESAMLLLMLKNQWVLTSGDSQRGDNQLGLRLNSVSDKRDIEYAVKISAGFAGYNGAVVFKAPMSPSKGADSG